MIGWCLLSMSCLALQVPSPVTPHWRTNRTINVEWEAICTGSIVPLWHFGYSTRQSPGMKAACDALYSVHRYATCHYFAWQCLKFRMQSFARLYLSISCPVSACCMVSSVLRTALALSFTKSVHDKECGRKTAFELLTCIWGCVHVCIYVYLVLTTGLKVKRESGELCMAKF